MSATALALQAPASAPTHPQPSGPRPVRPPLRAVPQPKVLPAARPLGEPRKPIRPTSKPLPTTSPTHTFDRLTFASPKTERPSIFLDDAGLDVPLPDSIVAPDRFAAAITGQAIEVLYGHRPPRQLQQWLHPAVFQALVRRAGLGQRICGDAGRIQRPRIRRAHVCMPRPRVAEISLVLHDGKKIRAAAVRLEVRREKWHVTALEII